MFYLRLGMTALRSLEAHFLRSLLATVGVLIGVGSVVACMSILEGATNRILTNFKSLGSNLIFIQPATARIEGRPVGRAQSLVVEDEQFLRRNLETEILGIAPQALGQASIKYFQKSDTYTVIATSDSYFTMNDYQAERGRVIARADADDELSLVATLGSSVAEELFGGMDPVGQTVKIRNTAYRVIGVMEKRGNIGFINADKCVYIPIRSGLKRFFNRRWLDVLTVQIEEGANFDELKRKIQRLLREAHSIRVGQPDDFEVDTLEETINNVSQATMIFKVVFYSIAGISLLVGGIGIMNIMLVSVTERTREIGVRIAVGARRADILMQFLVEALIISMLGGGFGLLLGMMFADLLDKVLEGMFGTEITATIVVTALSTTTIVGVASGLYPAFKASRLDPVEALRYE
ncbi:MAG: ABC transporter permease [Phycisphaerae bacterium]|jgi:putative ABC transport system permease protein